MENRMNKLLKLKTMTALGLAISTSTCYVNAMKPEQPPHVAKAIEVLGSPYTCSSENNFIEKQLSKEEKQALSDAYHSLFKENLREAYRAVEKIVLSGGEHVPAGYKPGITSDTSIHDVMAYSGLVINKKEYKDALNSLFLASKIGSVLKRYELVLPEETQNQLILAFRGRLDFPPKYLLLGLAKMPDYYGYVRDTLVNNKINPDEFKFGLPVANGVTNEILSIVRDHNPDSDAVFGQ